jgi:hypothetical protein
MTRQEDVLVEADDGNLSRAGTCIEDFSITRTSVGEKVV